MNCAAAIVIYNPKLDLLKSNIETILPQVEKLYCFNNNSINTDEIREMTKKYKNVEFINSSENIGIAAALNYVAKNAIKERFNWLLTLDQDSICPSNMINSFSEYMKLNDHVAIICPIFVDKRRPQVIMPTEKYSLIDCCITSGACTNLKILQQLGWFDEYLFVGWVDDEYCYRAILNHYKIIQVNSVLMQHELGELTPSRLKRFYLWLGMKAHSSKIQALSYKRKVSPKRVYLATRNLVYLSKKYTNYPCYKFSLKFARYNAMSDFLRGQQKKLIWKAICQGFKDGKKKAEMTDAYKAAVGNE